jgi:predicted transcriptional regulator
MGTDALNPNELETLRILWEKGALKPAQLQHHFAWPIENATLRSVLRNLVAKRHVARKLRGKAFFYQARVKKTALLQNMLHTMARVFAAGSKPELVAQLVKTGDIQPADLEVIRRTLAGGSADETQR